MALTTFRLVLHANSAGQVIVGDVDLSDRHGAITLDGRPGEPPRLVVEIMGEADVEGLGDVTLVRGVAELDTFFANIDAGELEREALSRLEGFGDQSATQAMLDVLAEWARRP